MHFFATVVPIVTFDLLENIDEYNDVIQFLTRSSPSQSQDKRLLQEADSQIQYQRISDQTFQLGYDSYNPMMNLGTLSLLLMIYVIKVLFVLLVLNFIKLLTSRVK